MYSLAISNNLELKNYENQMKIAKLNYDQAVSNLYFPSISLNSSTSIPFDTSKNTTASLNLNISKPIFNGFNLQKAKDLAYINYQYKKSIYQSKIAETKYLAFQYYYQYLVKLLNYKLYSQMVTINEKRLAEYDAKYKLGLITELDFLSLKLTFSKVETSFKNAENEKDIAYLTLKSFLNLKDDFKIEEEYDIENIDFTKIFNDNQIKIDESGQINLNEINLIEEAKKYDLSYLSALSSYLNCQINLKYYLASLFPSLSSSLGISYSGIFKDGSFNTNDPSFSISFSLSLDLDSLIAGSSKSIEKKQLEKELENAKINLLKAENDLSLSIKTKIKNIILSNQTVQNALNSFNYAEKGYKLAQDAFNFGQISASTFASWQEDYLNAKLSLYSAILSYQLSINSLLMSIGKN
ncbi:MAG: TolC family protein [Spirochaetota bacterium]